MKVCAMGLGAWLLCLAAAGWGEGAAPLAWRWRPVPALREPTAAAVDGARAAAGDGRGVLLWEDRGAAARVLRRGPVRDLRFAADGALYAATEAGLYRIEADGRVAELPLGSGLAARRTTRLAALGSLLAVGTERGAYLSRDGRRFALLDGALPLGRVDALALQRRGERLHIWLAIDGRLYRARLAYGEQGDVAVDVVREPLPSGGDGVVDLAGDVAGAELLVLLRDRMMWLREGRWHTRQPGLPPGATALRIGGDRERVYVATDRGLLRAEAVDGDFVRTPAPAGTAPVVALSLGGGRVLAVGSRGVLEGRPPLPGASAALPESPLARPLGPAALAARRAEEPSVQQVQRAALRYLGLTRSRIDELERGVDRRGWLPLFVLRGEGGAGLGLSHDYDQSFSSGEVRHLFDRQIDRGHDYGLMFTLTWDFGDLLYNPEAIDVSREARELIELRDEVLDEVTRFYFERQRVLSELAAAADPGEVTRLRLRGDELAAGIDAWTGGWFASHSRPLALASEPPSPVPQENQP